MGGKRRPDGNDGEHRILLNGKTVLTIRGVPHHCSNVQMRLTGFKAPTN